jgi:hypothetical protein
MEGKMAIYYTDGSSTIGVKKCVKCEKLKTIDNYYKNKRYLDGLFPYCKECKVTELRKWRSRNPDKVKNWRAENPMKAKETDKSYRENNKEKILKAINKHKKEHPESQKIRWSKWYENNKNNPYVKLNMNMSSSIRMSLLNLKASRHWESLVGYTVEHLKKHLEKQFKPGMSWENYGKWHIDHKIPKIAFNYKRPEDLDFRRCWALSNLQPLWAIENISKGAKLKSPFQPSLLV